MRGHLAAEGAEQTGSQSYVPPAEKDDKALVAAFKQLPRRHQCGRASLPTAAGSELIGRACAAAVGRRSPSIGGAIVSGLAAFFLDEVDALDATAALHRLDHVVDRKTRNRHRRPALPSRRRSDP